MGFFEECWCITIKSTAVVDNSSKRQFQANVLKGSWKYFKIKLSKIFKKLTILLLHFFKLRAEVNLFLVFYSIKFAKFLKILLLSSFNNKYYLPIFQITTELLHLWHLFL